MEPAAKTQGQDMPAYERAPLPRTLRAAIAILVLYGVFVLVNATVWQSLGGWEDWSDYPRGVLRAGMVALLAWGLVRRERWAWWIAVLLTGFWTVGGVAAALVTWRVAQGTVPFPVPAMVTLAVGGALIALAFVLLLLPSSRAAILRRAA